MPPESPLPPRPASKRLLVILIFVGVIAAVLYGAYCYFKNSTVDPILSERGAVHALIVQGNSARLHEIAESDHGSVGRIKWILANLYVADESYLFGGGTDASTYAEISLADAAGIPAVARTLVLNPTAPTQEEAVAWLVFAEKMRRFAYDPRQIDRIVQSNGAFFSAYQEALLRYPEASRKTSATRKSALLYVTGVNLETLYQSILTNPEYSTGFKALLAQQLSWTVFSYGSGTSDPTVLALRARIGKLLYSQIKSGPHVLDELPELAPLNQELYFSSTYILQRMWNIQAAYQWQLGREAGQDFSADDTLSYDMVHREYRLAIEAFDRAAKNTKVPGENWSFTAHGLRLSLILTTASASERVQSGVSKAEAMEIILNALKPIAALYQSDPQSPFFDYMRSLGNTVDTSALVAVLEGADDSESMAMLRALEW